MNTFKPGQYIVCRFDNGDLIVGCINRVGKNDLKKIFIKNLLGGNLVSSSNAKVLSERNAVVSERQAFHVVDIYRAHGKDAALAAAIKIANKKKGPSVYLVPTVSSSLESTIFQFKGLTTKDQQAFARRIFKDVLNTMFGVTVTKEI